MNERRGPRWDRLRLGVVGLLVVAAFFAAAPWLGCSLVPPFWIINAYTMRACTFGDPALLGGGWGLPGFNGPYWGNLIAGVAYLIAAFYLAFVKRSL
jgi:hypothetical protein